MNKSVLKSKTFYFGLLTALAPLIPAVQNVISNHTAEVGMFWGVLAIALRLITKDKIKLLP